VKITPSNQTLILASERRGAINPTGATSASKTGASGSTLSRVTIVATQPDTSVVYLRADYSPHGGDAVGGPITYGALSSGTAVAAQTSTAATNAPRGSTTTSYALASSSAVRSSSGGTSRYSGTSSSSYLNLKPAEQYAFTQRILSSTPVVQHIDAYA